MNKPSIVDQNIFPVKVVLNGVADLSNNNSQGNATFQACSLINLTFILMTLI